MWRSLFLRCFKEYIAPFLVEPNYSSYQIAEAVQRRLHDIARTPEAERIESGLRVEVGSLFIEESRGNPTKFCVTTDYSRYYEEENNRDAGKGKDE